MTIKFDEYGGKAVELPAMQALFSDYAVQHQPLVEAIHENEPVDDVAENAPAELRRDTRPGRAGG